MNKFKFSLFIVSYFLIHLVAAQYKLSGVISSSDSIKVLYCSVSLNDGKYGTMTDTTGYFEFINLPNGSYTISTSSIGYKPFKKTIQIHGKDKRVDLDIESDFLIHE